MITLVYGKPGAGKGIWFMKEILGSLERGRVVYTNFQLDTDAVISRVGCKPDRLRLFADPMRVVNDQQRPDSWHGCAASFTAADGTEVDIDPPLFRADGLFRGMKVSLKGEVLRDADIFLDEAPVCGLGRGGLKDERVQQFFDMHRKLALNLFLAGPGSGANIFPTSIREKAERVVEVTNLANERIAFGLLQGPPLIRVRESAGVGQEVHKVYRLDRDKEIMNLFYSNAGVQGKTPTELTDTEIKESKHRLFVGRVKWVALGLMGLFGFRFLADQFLQPTRRVSPAKVAKAEVRRLTPEEQSLIRWARPPVPPSPVGFVPGGVILDESAETLFVGGIYNGFRLVSVDDQTGQATWEPVVSVSSGEGN